MKLFRTHITKFLVAIATVFYCSEIRAQELQEFDMSDTTITICQGILYDSGGETGLYANNSNITTVINTGGVITLTFQGVFSIENVLDELTIYDGVGTGGPVLGNFTGTSLPGIIVATSGAVTLVFTSDNSAVYAGFTMMWETELPPPIPPTLSIDPSLLCGSNLFQVNFSYSLACAWVDAATFTFFRNGSAIQVLNVLNACTGDSSDYVVLNLAEPIDVNCTYLVHLDIEIPDVCEVFWPFEIEEEFIFNGCGIEGEIISSAETICPGSCADISFETNGCLTYTYNWNNGLPDTAGPHTVCPNITTSYNVVVTEVETGNAETFTFQLQIEGSGILTPDTSLCQSEESFFIQSENVGIWSGPGIQDENTGFFEPDSANAGVNIIYFEALGCLDSILITIEPIGTDDIVAACPGSAPFQLNSEPLGGVWSGTFTDPSGLFDPLSVGSYVAYYDVNSCQDSVIVNVDDISGDFSFDTLCQSIWYDTLVFAPIGGYWSGSGIVDSLLGVFAPSGAPPGDLELTYHINGCEQIYTGFIKEIYTGDSYHTACPLEEPQVFYSDFTPTGGTWVGAGIIDAQSGLFDPGLFPVYTFTNIIYYAPNGCSDTTYIDVILTDVGVTDLSFCLGDDTYELKYDNVFHVPSWGGVWTGPGITNPYYDGWFFSPSIAGVGTHTLYYERNTCIDSIIVSVFPDALNISPKTYCYTDTPEVLGTTQSAGGVWSGSGIANPNNGTFDPGIANAGTYYLYWNAPAGCIDSVSVTVEQLEEATISGLDANYCFIDSNYVFTTLPIGGVLTAPVTENLWNPAIAGEGEFQFVYSVAGIACASADTIDVVVTEEIVTSVSVSDTIVCLGSSSTIVVSAEGGEPTTQLTYTWSDGGFPINTHTITPTENTMLVITVNDGCSDPKIDSIYIEVFPPIDYEVITSDTLCFGDMGSAMVEFPSGGNYQVFWNSVESIATSAEAGSGLNLEIINLDSGCEIDTSILIPSYSPIIANFSLNPNEDCISYADREDVQIIDFSQNAVGGEWNLGGGEIVPYGVGSTPSMSFAGAGLTQISLIVFNEGGCADTAYASVCILPADPIFIPEIFSPNGDGNNDVFRIRGTGIVQVNCEIYNRYGERVYQIKTPDGSWNGENGGKPVPSGNYVYYADIVLSDGSQQKISGELTLIR